MVNYQNGKIYKIVSDNTDKIYIGSTTQRLISMRLSSHVRDFNAGKLLSSRHILKYGNYSVCLVELFPCNSVDELNQRERHYIETLDCVNKCIPGRTKQEYTEDNKEKIIASKRQYYKDNKEKITKRALQSINCECGITYTFSNKSRHYKSQRHIKGMSNV
tara:strand:- start:10 stop:492 length:483 start_codon:yes stop_codon:yes gene_type:complete